LSHENLIQVGQGRALQVATISMTGAAQLYDCRIALEELSVAGACQNATDAELAELKGMVQQAGSW
jgi:DNA-binding GntR family transcriptional regulator